MVTDRTVVMAAAAGCVAGMAAQKMLRTHPDRVVRGVLLVSAGYVGGTFGALAALSSDAPAVGALVFGPLLAAIVMA